MAELIGAFEIPTASGAADYPTAATAINQVVDPGRDGENVNVKVRK